MSNRKTVTHIGSALVVCLSFVILGGVVFFAPELISGLREYVNHSFLLLLVVFTLAYVLGLLVLIPNTPLAIVTGVLFGPWVGVMVIMVAGTVASTLAFVIARVFGERYVEKWLRKHMHHIYQYDRHLAERGFVTALVLRMTPFLPKGILNYLLGLSCIRFRDYIPATIIGMIPSSVLLVFVGDSVADASFAYIALFLALYCIFLGVVFGIKNKFDSHAAVHVRVHK